jgi:hypothetical protein
MFEAAVTSTGAPYEAARSRILSLRPAAVPQLKAVLASQPPWSRALTAQILLGWLESEDLYRECTVIARGAWPQEPGPRPITGKPTSTARAARLYQKGKPVIPRLLEMALKTSELAEPEEQAAVFGALRYFEEPTSLYPMIQILEEQEREEGVRVLAVGVLQTLSSPEGRDALLAGLEEADNGDKLRGAAGLALAELKDTRASATLTALALDRSAGQSLRLDALFALSILQDPEVERKLIRLLEYESDDMVVISVVNTLGDLGTQAAIPALENACHRWKDPDVCEATHDASQAIQDRNAEARQDVTEKEQD